MRSCGSNPLSVVTGSGARFIIASCKKIDAIGYVATEDVHAFCDLLPGSSVCCRSDPRESFGHNLG